MSKRWLIAVVVGVFVATGGAVVLLRESAVAGTPRAATPELTVWQNIETTASEDGTVPLRTALQAFGYLFGPLPGVPAPEGKPDPADFRVSGSGPIRWVLSHWDELTDAQRKAFLEKTIPPDDPPGLRRAQGDKARATAVLNARMGELYQEIGRRLQVAVRAPRLHVVDFQKDKAPDVRAWTFVLAEGEILLSAEYDSVYLNGGPAATCDIYVPPSAWNRSTSSVPADISQTLAHEITHCYQGFLYPNMDLQRHAPKWFVEGAADYVGSVIAGVAPAPIWQMYLATPAPLFDRSYTAMGYWFHLDHLGRDLWPPFATIWRGALGNNEAYAAVGGDLDDVYDTWASSQLRNGGFGDPWEVHGIDVTGDFPPRATLTAAHPVDAPAFDVRAVKLDPGAADGELIVRLSAGQPIRVHDSESFEEVHVTEGDYCLGAKCVCPKDTELEGKKFQQVTAPLWLGVPGGEVGTQAVTDTVSLMDYCRKKAPKRKQPKASPPQPAGFHPHGGARNPHGPDGKPPSRPSSGTAGDPHIETLAGYRYDFQAGGEFTLSRSDSGDLDVQVRQEPLRVNGVENTTVTVNTAMAASIAGDRVAVYGDGPALRIDGSTVDLTEERQLPHGGTVAPLGDGYLLRWPDGSEVWAVTAVPGSLNVLVGPAPARAGTLTGLLGGTATGLVDRDGKRYEKPKPDVLYPTVGESWRVGDTSLFDYEPGQSTATFTRPELPTAPAEPTPAQRAAAEQACANVEDPGLHAHCVFDVAVSGDNRFADGYRALEQVSPSGGGDVRVGDEVGPERLEPGQQKSFTVVDGAAKELFFAAVRECAGQVFWQVTGPDGTKSALTGMCNDIARWQTTKPGTWRIDVNIPPDAKEGAEFGFRVLRPGTKSTVDATLPVKVSQRDLKGPGAEIRYRFAGRAGETVTLTSDVECDPENHLEWGLENPSASRITLRTPVCADLGPQKLDVPGTWSVVVYNPTTDDTKANYGFTAARS
jgi:hypothetical protein